MGKKLGFRMVLVCSVCCLLAGLLLAPAAFAQDDAKPKHSIKEVMKMAQKDGLAKKVIAGDATEEEKKMLLDLFISLLEDKPPQGDMESWQKLSGAAALAAAKVVVGRDGATDALKAANNCKACHDVHKPKA